MRRSLSIFLMLFVAILVAFQPTFAFHYCNGEGHSSVSFGKNTAEACCCCEAESDMDIDNKNNSLNVPHLSETMDGCCSETVLNMKTDNFQESQFTPSIESPIFTLIAGFLQNTVPYLSELCSSAPRQFVFPPGSHTKYSSDFLSLICIYRI
jgi:hypothetical protein